MTVGNLGEIEPPVSPLLWGRFFRFPDGKRLPMRRMYRRYEDLRALLERKGLAPARRWKRCVMENGGGRSPVLWAGAAWMALHVWAAVYNLTHGGVDKGPGHGFGWQGGLLAAAYLLAVLAAECLLLMRRRSSAALGLAGYWTAALVLCGVFTQVYSIADFPIPGLLGAAATPMLPLLPFWARFPWGAPVSAGGFCLLNGLFCGWIWRRCNKGGKSHGPVGSGAGTVE